MPFTTSTFILYENAGGTLTQTAGSIISDDDIVHVETEGVIADTFEEDEAHDSSGAGIGGTRVTEWQGTIQFDGKTFHVFELDAPVGAITHIVGTAASLVGEGFTGTDPAQYPPSISLGALSTTDFPHCFAPGTQIATPQGPRAVETLQIGDRITRAEGGSVAVKWIGWQVLPRPAAMPARLEPVRIAQGALGNGLPHRDLVVSADHGLVLDGYVVNASALVDGDAIRFVARESLPRDFTYYHIETEAHDAILAEGAPAETFVDAATRRAFDNHHEYLALFGAERLVPEMSLPRISSRRLLPQSVLAQLGRERAAIPEIGRKQG